MVFCDITGVGIIEEENKAGDRECTQLNSTQLTRVFVSVFPSTFFGDDIPPLSVLQYIRAVRTYVPSYSVLPSLVEDLLCCCRTLLSLKIIL